MYEFPSEQEASSGERERERGRYRGNVLINKRLKITTFRSTHALYLERCFVILIYVN